jgi:hypothetical protein
MARHAAIAVLTAAHDSDPPTIFARDLVGKTGNRIFRIAFCPMVKLSICVFLTGRKVFKKPTQTKFNQYCRWCPARNHMGIGGDNC